jgi:hypothetical protein
MALFWHRAEPVVVVVLLPAQMDTVLAENAPEKRDRHEDKGMLGPGSCVCLRLGSEWAMN